MPEPITLSEPEQDAIVLEIYELATQRAARLVARCYREDVVHDFVLECLEQLRTGVWVVPSETLAQFVDTKLTNRRTASRRKRLRAVKRDFEYLMMVGRLPRGWMARPRTFDDDLLHRFADRVRSDLPKKAVRAHRLVRDHNKTYAQAARKLRLSSHSVHKYVETVQRSFRHELPAIGITPPPAGPAARLPGPRRGPTRSRRFRTTSWAWDTRVERETRALSARFGVIGR